jgi:2-polyprenyl-6-methoxyphenol hydroxylase-like FAD-dependent oxidoreductase
MSRKPRVAIIGGGIGGLTAAIAMVRRGFEVSLHERSPAIGEIGAGITLSPNSMKAYRALDIDDQIAAIGFESDYQVVRAWDSGKEISRVYRKGTYEKEFGAPYYSMHRADLVEALGRNLPAGVLNLGAQCVRAENNSTGAAAKFADGKEIEADLVVGADGIHSAVRESTFGEQAPRFTGTVCWRGLVPYDRFPAGLISKDLNLYMGPKRHLIHYMVRCGDVVNFVAHVETDSWTDESWTQECDRSEVLDTFAGWHEPLLKMIGAADSYYKWALYDRDPLQNWSKGRIVLLGDSAHAMPPFIGQGAGMAIEDGYTLAAMIDRSPDDIDAALAGYERLRVPRASRAVLESRARGEEMHVTSKLGQLRRNLMMTMKRRLGGDKTGGVRLGEYYQYDVAAAAAAEKL